MTIASILHGKPHRLISVAPDESLQHATEVLTRERIGALLVLKPNGDIAGIISERDIIRAVGVQGADVLARPVAELMTKEVTCCAPEDAGCAPSAEDAPRSSRSSSRRSKER